MTPSRSLLAAAMARTTRPTYASGSASEVSRRACGPRPGPVTAAPACSETSGQRRCFRAGSGAQRLGLVRVLPRELGLVAAEVAVRRGLAINRAQQVEHLD